MAAGFGLERFAPAFRNNEIDESVLPSLTAEDLKDLGVTLVGHHRRLLDAIAALGAEAPVAAPARSPAPSDLARGPRAAPTQTSRRQDP